MVVLGLPEPLARFPADVFDFDLGFDLGNDRREAQLNVSVGFTHTFLREEVLGDVVTSPDGV
ncbi:hypothetical protein D6U17_00035 [Lactiplantibacillus pentosus]|jgi:hypothetical protein|uniref:Uncharacterized protein n=1 Tax=Lactiplantibacillus pentosus TaxID=1589 RepID=A0AB37RLH3_LACPE|nr:hypothetical protein D6U20_01285 [Lactiplantibacillus pentosus]RMW49924.1 hypothetical protein D6U19_01145 [Lactiplantibacillus pentosus]RMW57246.1 hypothetical protein D6U21_02030 [Lactiplantibacillus pentosus]RMW57657.1 hypothetical protein D6U17_00035 [Lactiplantibacillus pentosus]